MPQSRHAAASTRCQLTPSVAAAGCTAPAACHVLLSGQQAAPAAHTHPTQRPITSRPVPCSPVPAPAVQLLGSQPGADGLRVVCGTNRVLPLLAVPRACGRGREGTEAPGPSGWLWRPGCRRAAGLSSREAGAARRSDGGFSQPADLIAVSGGLRLDMPWLEAGRQPAPTAPAAAHPSAARTPKARRRCGASPPAPPAPGTGSSSRPAGGGRTRVRGGLAVGMGGERGATTAPTTACRTARAARRQLRRCNGSTVVQRYSRRKRTII